MGIYYDAINWLDSFTEKNLEGVIILGLLLLTLLVMKMTSYYKLKRTIKEQQTKEPTKLETISKELIEEQVETMNQENLPKEEELVDEIFKTTDLLGTKKSDQETTSADVVTEANNLLGSLNKELQTIEDRKETEIEFLNEKRKELQEKAERIQELGRKLGTLLEHYKNEHKETTQKIEKLES